MVSGKRGLNRTFFLYLAIVLIASLIYLTGLPWQRYVIAALQHYEAATVLFTIVVFCLIPFRVYFFEKKRVDFGMQRFRALGPLVSYITDPLYDAALFYSALFMLYTVFQHELSIDPLLVLLLVSTLLLYESMMDLFRLIREMFYAQSMQNIKTA